MSPLALPALCCAAYMGALLWLALRVEARPDWRRRVERSPLVYALSLSVLCSTWTFYGSVGRAATSGLSFLSFYVGIATCMAVWWIVVRKLARLKTVHRITSIADFLSGRYGKSRLVAGLATIIALFGTVPYVALQMRGILSSLQVLAGDAASGAGGGPDGFALPLAAFMILFTILVGVRRLDPTERHQGVMTVVALESLVKLGAFLLVGVYVTYGLFDGFGDIIARIAATPHAHIAGIARAGGVGGIGGAGEIVSSYTEWTTAAVVSMAAILFLPRQFHVAVVENSDENHIRTAMWLFPLYLFLITIFVLPVAGAGLLYGYPASEADTFVLRLPLDHGRELLGMLVFLGGFSAGMSMIVVSAMTMSTMLTNHLVLPLVDALPALGFLRRRLLPCRWGAVAAFIGLGYFFDLLLGRTPMLVTIGAVSFVGVFQFAPAGLGGLFWPRGCRVGALAGLGGGFLVWLYTLLLPSLAGSGLVSASLLSAGPFGIGWLRPHQLFGLGALDPLSHSLFWSGLVNVACYVGFSLLCGEDERRQAEAREFTGSLEHEPLAVDPGGQPEPMVPLGPKVAVLEQLFGEYFPAAQSRVRVRRVLADSGCDEGAAITIERLAAISASAEHSLSGVVGNAAASRAVAHSGLYTETEARRLSERYAGMLARLRLSPAELRRRMDSLREREALLAGHARELEEANDTLRAEVRDRVRAERETLRLQRLTENLFDSMPSVLVGLAPDGTVTRWNRAAETATGLAAHEAVGRPLNDVYPELASEREIVRETLDTGLPRTAPRIPRPRPGGLRYEDVTVFPVLGDGLDVGSDGGPGGRRIEGSVVRVDDVTMRVQMEEMMIQTEKMMSVGGLAAGMAHEINNPLGVILAAAQGVERRFKGDLSRNVETAAVLGVDLDRVALYMEERGILDYLAGIREAGERAAGIVRNMLNFSRKSESSHAACDIAELLNNSVALAGSDYDLKRNYDFRKIEIVREYEPGLPPVSVAETEIEQVFLNIIKNAAEAMCGDDHCSHAPRLVLRVSRSGDSARVEIRDNGPGMTEEVRRRIFEPFFTTKGVGYGTGLGLSVSYFIVTKNHAGDFRVVSRPGEGATFIIILPFVPSQG